jgi:hypothetical protein
MATKDSKEGVAPVDVGRPDDEMIGHDVTATTAQIELAFEGRSVTLTILPG